MVDVGYTAPTNKILVAGSPLIQVLKVETATNMYAGRLVIQGTNDDDVTVAGVWALNSCAVGWLGYEQTIKKHRPATVATIYAQDAQAAVLNGGGFVIAAKLQASQGTLKKGDALVQGTTGCVAKATAQTAVIPTGSTTVVSTANTSVATTQGGGIPAQGPIVGFAEESLGNVADLQAVMVRSVL